MGILRSREELLPVTCAVLKESDREAFFSDIRRKVGGNMDRVAKSVGVPVSTLQDWVNGAANIPYIALQRLASELGVEMPSVTELRREYQQIVPAAAPRRPAARMPSHPGPVGGAGREEPRRETRKEPRREPRREDGVESGGREYEPLRKAESSPKPASERPARRERNPRRGRRGAEAKPAKPARQERPEARRPASGPRIPKLSEEAAYWAGATIALARREGDLLVVAADKRIGQNYAATWAGLCQDLFGVKAALSMSEDHRTQEARLPVAGLEEFVNRLDLKPDAPRPPAPRWAWSNPDWKKSFLKGLVDASAEFHRTPALQLNPFGETLKRSTEKLLASFGIVPKAAEDGSLSIEGADLEKYNSAVGTDNLKLRDQLKAFFRPQPAEAAPPAQQGAAAAVPAEGKPRGRRRRGRGRRGGRGRTDAAPAAAADAIPEAPLDGVEPQQAPAPAPEPPAEPRELPVDERLPEV